MVIYLLANNPSVIKLLEGIDISEADLLVAFNVCIPMGSRKFLNHKNKIIICRQISPVSVNFFGKKNIKRYSEVFKEIRIVRQTNFTKEQLNYYKKLKKSYPMITCQTENKCDYLCKNRHSKKTLMAQGGFVGYCMMKQQYPNEEIKLVGFTRFPDKNEGHSYLHEKQFYSRNKVEFIV